MKNKSLLITLLILNFITHAQQLTQTIRGIVMDQLSQTSLPGATVIIFTTAPPVGTTTDAEGRFRIDNIPIGRQSLKISFIGYKDFTASNLIINSNKEVVLNIELEEEAIQMEEIMITEKKASNEVNNELISISARGFDSEETNRYAGSFEDVSRMVSNYAGVSGANDARNDIIVRGNSPLGVLWRLEGIDIPNPNHFSTQGANGGPISIINNNLLSKSDFLTGAFPAEYGNKTAAVFDIRLRNGNDEKYEFASQMGFNGMELMAEGPISKKHRSSFLASYRYSTLEIFEIIGLDLGIPAIPYYQDMSFKLHYPTKKFGNFALFGIGGLSHISIIDAERKRSKDGKNLASEAQEGFDVRAGSRMGVVGLTNKHIFNNTTYGKFSLSISGTDFSVNQDSIGYDEKKIVTGKFQNYDDGSNNTTVNSEYVLNHKINSKHFIKTGAKYSLLGYRLFEILREDTISNSNGSTGLLQSFVHWQWKISGVMTANFGIHHQTLVLNKKNAIEPRMGLKWNITEKGLINIGAGIHNQMHPLEIYLRETELDGNILLTNKNLDFARSLHFITGYNYFIDKNWIIKTEGYYQKTDQIPVEGTDLSSYSMFNEGTSYNGIPYIDSLVSKGKARTYGMEFTLERLFSDGFYLMANGSVFRSEYFGSDEIWRRTAFDQSFIINLLSGAEFDISKNKKHVFVTDIKGTYAAGRNYTPMEVDSTVGGVKFVRYLTDQAYTIKFKDYSRIDVKAGFRENFKHATITWFITVQNIFNTNNILTRVFNPNSGKIEDVYQLGRLPIGGFKIEF